MNQYEVVCFSYNRARCKFKRIYDEILDDAKPERNALDLHAEWRAFYRPIRAMNN